MHMKDWNSQLPPQPSISQHDSSELCYYHHVWLIRGNKILSSDGQNSILQDNLYSLGMDEFDSGK